jgi:endonuclease G, mitochondrial
MDKNIRALFPPPAPERELDLETAKPRLEDYDNRNGYSPGFLGEGPAFEIPLPLLKAGPDMAPVARAKHGRPFELCYQNFSVVMQKSRRLCCVTGVNIDGGATFFHPKRPGWRTDPRVPEALQVGNKFYVPTSFDRGHMVRRLDPVWGEEGKALLANDDTHHYTNSCPQVHSFNDVTWGDLEDWILSQQQTRDAKGSVFTGPIFNLNDPVYEQIKVPISFYKIIAVIDDQTNKLSVTAFRQSQKKVMTEGPVPEAPFDPGPFSVDQVTVRRLENDTGIDFGKLKTADVLATHPVVESAGLIGPIQIPITSAREAILWAQ